MSKILFDTSGILSEKTNTILSVSDGSTDSTLSISIKPSTGFFISIKSESAGSAYITGTVGGVSTTERIDIESSNNKQSSNEFSSVSGITLSGFSGSLTFKSVTRSGQPVISYSTVYSNIDCSIQDASVSYVPGNFGEKDVDEFRIYLDYRPGFSVYRRNVLYADGQSYEISSVLKRRDFVNRPFYWQCRGFKI